jgi:ABC-type glycerol-3-phosphate transport system substrate-binding protein
MMKSRASRASATLALAMLLASGGVVGCGGGGSGSSSDGEVGSSAIPKAEAVDVTYYFLPG